MELFAKLSTGFSLSWDPVDLETKFTEEIQSPANNPAVKLKGDNTPHWQYYVDTGVRFARNFSTNFPEQCKEVVIKLHELQIKLGEVTQTSVLINQFLSHKFSYLNVNLIKVEANTSVLPHTDLTRGVAINIGLKNSNIAQTSIIASDDVNQLDKFHEYKKFSFTMQDGDVYLLSVKHIHAVESLPVEHNGNRYIITYTMIGK